MPVFLVLQGFEQCWLEAFLFLGVEHHFGQGQAGVAVDLDGAHALDQGIGHKRHDGHITHTGRVLVGQATVGVSRGSMGSRALGRCSRGRPNSAPKVSTKPGELRVTR